MSADSDSSLPGTPNLSPTLGDLMSATPNDISTPPLLDDDPITGSVSNTDELENVIPSGGTVNEQVREFLSELIGSIGSNRSKGASNVSQLETPGKESAEIEGKEKCEQVNFASCEPSPKVKNDDMHCKGSVKEKIDDMHSIANSPVHADCTLEDTPAAVLTDGHLSGGGEAAAETPEVIEDEDEGASVDLQDCSDTPLQTTTSAVVNLVDTAAESVLEANANTADCEGPAKKKIRKSASRGRRLTRKESAVMQLFSERVVVPIQDVVNCLFVDHPNQNHQLQGNIAVPTPRNGSNRNGKSKDMKWGVLVVKVRPESGTNVLVTGRDGRSPPVDGKGHRKGAGKGNASAVKTKPLSLREQVNLSKLKSFWDNTFKKAKASKQKKSENPPPHVVASTNDIGSRGGLQSGVQGTQLPIEENLSWPDIIGRVDSNGVWCGKGLSYVGMSYVAEKVKAAMENITDAVQGKYMMGVVYVKWEKQFYVVKRESGRSFMKAEELVEMGPKISGKVPRLIEWLKKSDGIMKLQMCHRILRRGKEPLGSPEECDAALNLLKSMGLIGTALLPRSKLLAKAHWVWFGPRLLFSNRSIAKWAEDKGYRKPKAMDYEVDTDDDDFMD